MSTYTNAPSHAKTFYVRGFEVCILYRRRWTAWHRAAGDNPWRYGLPPLKQVTAKRPHGYWSAA